MPTAAPRSLVVLATGITAGVVALAGPASAAVPVDGSAGGGDPYFPRAGNGGYQVDDYDLSIRYEPRTARFDATAVLTAVARKDLASFSLDLRDLTVRAVRVDGLPATFTRSAEELRVVPARPLVAGRTFTVGVSYGGTTGRPTDASGALYGWVSTPDGAVVANEPEGASTWYPVNDVPTDKATYTFRVDVPSGKVAVANGDLVATSTRDDRTTYTWRMAQPMASYLSTASIGNYALTRSRTSSGLPIVNAVDKDLPPAEQARAATSLARQGEMVDFFTQRFGPYPFTSFGAIVDDDSVDYALETQTRPVYSGAPSQGTVAHELAHQWFGDSVTLSTWDDLWLNEGFATYAEWVWEAEHGGPVLQRRFDAVYGRPASDPFWRQAPGDPGVADLFGAAVYDRGAATLVALRDTIGDADFGTLLHRWAAQHRDGNVTTADLVRLASQVSGQDLAPFFRTWIDTPRKPTTW